MEDRFKIEEIYICPIYTSGEKYLMPDYRYPTRCCVIDEEKEIAIDIKTKLKYNYLKTKSRLFIISQIGDKIFNNKLVAITPLALKSSYDVKEAFNIIEQLKNGVEFQDGNEVFNNEQYLEYLNQEKVEKVNEPQKVKQKSKIFKKRKK